MNKINYDNHIKKLLRNFNDHRKPISIDFRKEIDCIKNLDRYTHFIHPYPAKLLQHIPYFFLNNNIFSQENDIVLDPFCGSGTVVLESKLSNRNTIGIDINPLATLIAKTKTTRIDSASLEKWLVSFKKSINSKIPRYKFPLITNMSLWYNEAIIKDLAKIKHHIDKISDEDIKQFYLTMFSICCRKFSYSDPRISVPVRINKDKYPPGHKFRIIAENNIDFIETTNIFDQFIELSQKNIIRVKNFTKATENLDNSVNIYNLDINDYNYRNETGKIQLILTSPPYVSAQKYIRASSLSIQWLELSDSISNLNNHSIGREDFPAISYKVLHKFGIVEIDNILEEIFKLNPLRSFITYNYLCEMDKTFHMLYNLLRNNGYFIIVIGNNTIAGLNFYTHRYLISIAERIGFKTKLILMDEIKSRGLMTKRNKAANIITREYIIVFRKE